MSKLKMVRNHKMGCSQNARSSLVPLSLLLCVSIVGLVIASDRIQDVQIGKSKCEGIWLNGQINSEHAWQPTRMCVDFLKYYMENGPYEADFFYAIGAASSYLSTISPDEEVDAIVLDIDDTALSNLPYYEQHHYGADDFQEKEFYGYIIQNYLPPLPETLSLYNDLKGQGWQLIFITGRDETTRQATVKSLKAAGFDGWSELVMRQPKEKHESAMEYKSKRRMALESKGYRIRTSIGDQWSDINGPAAGDRVFKLPNPMYYVN